MAGAARPPLRDRIATAIASDTIAVRDDQLVELERQYDESLGLMRERLAELEIALEDDGWWQLDADDEASQDFSLAGRRKIIRLARIMYLKNPLIRRAVNVQIYYVFGQGVEISGRVPEVDEVLHRFLDAPANRRALTSKASMKERERDLQTDGEIFLATFVNPETGGVRLGLISPEEIVEVISNPDDAGEPWYYRRRWTRRSLAEDGSKITTQEEALYPALGYMLTGEAGTPSYAGTPIATDAAGQPAAIYHVRVGSVGRMRRGVPDVYAALDWARAYKTFLEDAASLLRSLSRWAWKVTTGRQRVADVKRRIGTTLTDSTPETNPAPSTGAAFVQPAGVDLTAIPKSGATISPDEGRGLRLMVASAVDLPDTILSGDPDMGNLATAKTLDRPTELAMLDRQDLWAGVFADLGTFALLESIRAQQTPGSFTVDDGRIEISLPDVDGPDGPTKADATIEVTFPPILATDTKLEVDAIVAGATLGLAGTQAGTIPEKALAHAIMTVLGFDNVDELVDELFPADEDPEGAPDDGAAPDDQGVPPQPTTDDSEALGRARRSLRDALVTP